VGDAELDEGSNHEAIAFAGATGLDRLHTLVIDNSSASHALPGGIAARFTAAGWSTATADGRDHEALYAAYTRPHPGRPHAVIARVEPKRA
jgi:transketolase